MVRVLHVLHELRPSGAEVGLVSAAPHWAAHGIEAEILSVGESLGVFAPELRAAGYRLHHLPQDPYRAFAGRYRALIRDFDVVQIHVERGNFYNGLVALAAGGPRVVHVAHSCFQFSGPLRAQRRLQRLVLRAAGATFVSVSPSVERSERARFGNPTTRILNWYDEVRFTPPTPAERLAARAALGIGEGELAILSVGNCHPVKNHVALIEAVGTLVGELPLRYLHAGIEPDASERELAASLGAAPVTTFLGHVADVAALHAAADCYVMPSLHEGLPVAALEAAGAGAQLVFADSPGLRDLRELGVPAQWVEPTAHSIADGLRSVSRLRPDERAARSAEAVATARQTFSARHAVAEYARMYRGERWADASAPTGTGGPVNVPAST